LPNESPRIAVVVNPQTLHRTTDIAWQYAIGRLRRDANVCVEMETEGEHADVDRLIDLIRLHEPAVVVAGGGDGTVSDVVRALMAVPQAPALAILPLGTGNNVARSLGLSSFRHQGKAAADRAVAAIVGGRVQPIDLGEVDGRLFIGSFAVGMDADILSTRNRLRRSLRLGRKIGGYPLYLWSCAVNVFRPHGGPAKLMVNGSCRRVRLYNLLITNTPIYAGEFRFVAGYTPDDGWLDLHQFDGPADYLRRYPAAWRRHVRYQRRLGVSETERERVRNLVIETEQPVRAQRDGEEVEAAARFVVRVLPAALEVKVPIPDGVV
jgi:diacylglycerol kinase family enzyme